MDSRSVPNATRSNNDNYNSAPDFAPAAPFSQQTSGLFEETSLPPPRRARARAVFPIRRVSRLASPPQVVFRSKAASDEWEQSVIPTDVEDDIDDSEVLRIKRKTYQPQKARVESIQQRKRAEDDKEMFYSTAVSTSLPQLLFDMPSAALLQLSASRDSTVDRDSASPCSSHSSTYWGALVGLPGHLLDSPKGATTTESEYSYPSVTLHSHSHYPTPPRSESPTRPTFLPPTPTSPHSSDWGSFLSVSFPSTSSNRDILSEPLQLAAFESELNIPTVPLVVEASYEESSTRAMLPPDEESQESEDESVGIDIDPEDSEEPEPQTGEENYNNYMDVDFEDYELEYPDP